MSTARVILVSSESGARSFALTGDQISIGRATVNDIILQDARASCTHLRREWDGENLELMR